MRKFLLIVVLLLSGLQFANQVSAQTTKAVGIGANYATLKIAFYAINTVTIVIQIISSTTETASEGLNASVSYSSVKIYPTVTDYTISVALATLLIDLYGAEKLNKNAIQNYILI